MTWPVCQPILSAAVAHTRRLISDAPSAESRIGCGSEAHHDVLASGKGVMSTSSQPASPSACKQPRLKLQLNSMVPEELLRRARDRQVADQQPLLYLFDRPSNALLLG